MPTLQTPDDGPKSIVFDGGPLDGTSWSELEGDDVSVKMSDGHKHRYLRTSRVRVLPDGSSAHVFEWTGRYYGPE